MLVLTLKSGDSRGRQQRNNPRGHVICKQGRLGTWRGEVLRVRTGSRCRGAPHLAVESDIREGSRQPSLCSIFLTCEVGKRIGLCGCWEASVVMHTAYWVSS